MGGVTVSERVTCRCLHCGFVGSGKEIRKHRCVRPTQSVRPGAGVIEAVRAFAKQHVYSGGPAQIDQKRIVTTVSDILLAHRTCTVDEVLHIEPNLFVALKDTELCCRRIPQEGDKPSPRELKAHLVTGGGQLSRDYEGKGALDLTRQVIEILKEECYGSERRHREDNDVPDARKEPARQHGNALQVERRGVAHIHVG